jgi:hypothetical protein
VEAVFIGLANHPVDGHRAVGPAGVAVDRFAGGRYWRTVAGLEIVVVLVHVVEQSALVTLEVGTARVPLSPISGVVAGARKELVTGDEGLGHARLRNPRVARESVPVQVHAGQERCPGGTTQRRGAGRLCEARAVGCETVEVGGVDDGTAGTGKRVETQLIGEDEQDVRR